MKEFNAESKQCRKTTISPTFGGPINRLLPVKGSDDMPSLFAYSTSERIIGLGALPLTGNPEKVIYVSIIVI